MAYLDQANRHSPGGMIAALGVQGGIVTALILGLSVTGIAIKKDERVIGVNLPDPPKPPPPPEPPPEPAQSQETTLPDIFVPDPPVRLDTDPIEFGTREEIDIDFSKFPPAGGETGEGSGGKGSEPILSFDPVRARPRNDPADWVRTRDYRTSWIRRELVGTARFRLEIAATGRVTGCAITGSTGHEALDRATCELVSKRAKFQPARDSSGDAVPGSYSSAVSWELP